MAVKLRLTRMGAKKRPSYRIVASDSRQKRDGEYLELVGTYDPIANETKIDESIALKWLKNGATPTDTVRDILSKQGIMKEFHESKFTKSTKEAKVEKKETVKKETAKKETVKKETAKKTTTKKATTKKSGK